MTSRTFIFITSVVAVYALRNTLFDVAVMCLFGFVGYFFKKFDYSLPAFIIAFITRGSCMSFITRGSCMSFMLCLVSNSLRSTVCSCLAGRSGLGV